MRGPGTLQMIEIAAGLSIAGPMFIIGFDFVRSGQLLFGGGMFAFGIVAMFLPSYLIRKTIGFFRNIGGPKTWILQGLGRARTSESDPDSESLSSSEPEPEPETSHSSSGLFDRFRNN
ncbi:hypothetical protein OB955_07915 [Halobacteria archaeon AArc-m2/3/4]|uniref:Uncharacterized protein n=1 Tax=Natronoglomus mannanivorans TaxID=2979990 RepID=A0AAP3E0R2_9EURY|nr:hypothetical protein [Halobacteria archaeon AArc-xg1-1]MCU4972663.1 hypothetical protein [Halobacteria archaeon AArc-m2/3/4]